VSTALIHAVRNTLEHGFVGDSEQRASVFQVLLAVDSGQLVVRIQDDGPGLKPSPLTSEDSDPYEKIFAPGYTSRPVPNPLSGTGIGLDAVRSALLAVSGSVRAFPVLPHGFGLSLTVPLDVVALEAVEVRVGSGSAWFSADQVDVIARSHPEEEQGASLEVYEVLGATPRLGHLDVKIRSPAHQLERLFRVDSVSRPRLRVFRPLDPSWRTLGGPFLRAWMERVEGPVLGGRADEGQRELTPLADPISWLSFAQEPLPAASH
jgi:chemotaxis protein histidine kinase CheA